MELNNNCERMLLEEERKLSLTQVSSVDGFSEEILRLTIKNKKVVIKGSNLKITQFDKGSGNFCAEGNFYQIIFMGEKKPIMKKIFK
ncbi:MAG: YabP/YqfC family sporulation protein [Firmicutes bacterium]|nr:YabP/YqfC family sporulation protein [Candidatus Caballimonas caccae]